MKLWKVFFQNWSKVKSPKGCEAMKITIELNNEDIVKADETNFEALFVLIQSFTKSLKVGAENIMREKVSELHAEKNSKAEQIDRAEIEKQIKQIALEGKEKGASAKIKELIHGYGVEKLSAVPDDKMTELLQKVQDAIQ